MENEIKESDDDENKLIICKNNEKKIDNNNTDNYFKKAFLSRLKLNIFIIILSIISFNLEFFYREPLFNYSIFFEKKWQKKASEATIITFKLFTKIGGEYFMAIPVLIVFCFFTLIKSYIFITFFIFCLQFHSLMKVWYGNKRPFWERTSLYKGICDGGFGNPSGHSITTTFLYLSLFIYFKETKRLYKKYFILIIILIIFLAWIIIIILSRIILGLHSINQVIYGATLGVIISLFVFIVFKIHRMPVSVYKKFFREKKYIYISISVYLVFIAITIINYFIVKKGFDYDKYNDILDEVCEKKVAKYRRFNADGLFGSSAIFAMFGMYLGQIIFWYLIENKYKNNEINTINEFQSLSVNEEKVDCNAKKNKSENESIISLDDSIDDLINHWNKNRVLLCSNFKTVLKIIMIIIICALPVILLITIPNSSNLALIFTFKIGLPFFSTPFLLYSFGFFYIIKFSCGSCEILMKRVDQSSI